MGRPKGTNLWEPIPADKLWEWYWEDLLTPGEIAVLWGDESRKLRRHPNASDKHPCSKWVTEQLRKNKIPQRSASERASLRQKAKERKLERTSDRRYRRVYEEFYKDKILDDEQIHHIDYVQDNDHPLNLTKVNRADHTRVHLKTRTSYNASSVPDRMPLFEVYMRMSDDIAARSHHPTTKVGCVITSFDLRRVLSVGFNGNASGLADEPDCDEPGLSGTIHAEENALIFAGEHGTDRVMFVTESPCLLCTKLLINAGIKYIYYRRSYRDKHPLKIARYRGVMTCQYDKWQDTEWVKKPRR